MRLLDELTQLESGIDYRNRLSEAGKPFQFEYGDRPILLSAPHATTHTRSGDEKMEEEFTAGVVRYLAKMCDCHAIFSTHLQDEDPNWDEDSAYKNAIADAVERHGIQAVIDIHGMTNRHNIGVALGTMHGRSLVNLELSPVQPFLDVGFEHVAISSLETLSSPDWRRVVVDHPKFTGGLRSHTVTRFVVEELGLPALQVELTSAVRIVYRGPNSGWPFEYWGDEAGIKATMRALRSLIAKWPVV